MKKQIFIIHGGVTFKNRQDYLHFLKTRKISIDKKKRWYNEYLEKHLGKKFDIIKPRFPLQDNATYNDWKIHFERHLPYIRKDVVLIGASLGGIFLAKYLSENKFPKKILATYIICPPYDNTLLSEDLVGGFKLKSDLSLLDRKANNVTLLFSEDDDVIPIEHAEKYRKKLKNSKIIIYKSKNGHFKISKFPEIIKMIKDDVKRN